jgi:tetratricopeptide (TPR) repeat protein
MRFMADSTECNRVFYGRSKEIELFETTLESKRGALIFRGEHGIGKTELVKQLALRAQTHQKHRIACAYVEAWPSMLATDPFVDVLTMALDSFASLESTTEKATDRLERLGRALADEANVMLAALLTDIAEKVVGEQTASTLKRVLAKYKDMKSDIDSARSRLSSETRSFIYLVNTILTLIHRSNPDMKAVLVLDQLERTSESAWWIFLDLVRGMPEGVYVLAAFRHEAEAMPKNLGRLFLEASRIEGVRVRELEGLENDAIAEWIRHERHVDLLSPQVSRIRQNSGGFPIVLSAWISRSGSLDPEELRGADLRKSVCEEVMRRMTEQPLDLSVVRFLHQLSILDSPLPIEVDRTSYERLTGLDSMTVSYYSELLERRWILDGNREKPWFRHELIKACIEEDLRGPEKTELHGKAARFYEELFDAARKSSGRVFFPVGLGCAYHFHYAGDYKKSLQHNAAVGNFSMSVGLLDVSDACFRRAIEAAKNLGEESAIMRARDERARVLARLGRIEEARRIFDESLTFFEGKDEDERAMVFYDLGIIEEDQGNYDKAKQLFGCSLKIYQDRENRGGISRNLHELGIIAGRRSRYDEAENLIKQSLEMDRETGDKKSISNELHNLANVAEGQGQYDEAERLLNESLQISEGLGDREGICARLLQLGIVAGRRGQYDEAEKFLNRSLEIAYAQGYQAMVSVGLSSLGMIFQNRGRYEEAEALLRKSLEVIERLGDQAGTGTVLHQLGLLLESTDRLNESENCISKASEIFTRIGNNLMQEQASRDLNRIRNRLRAEGGLKS